jgi:hypothetical protein
MRSCRRELPTRGNFDGAEDGISYPLLCLVPGWFGYNFPKVHGRTFGTLQYNYSSFFC